MYNFFCKIIFENRKMSFCKFNSKCLSTFSRTHLFEKIKKIKIYAKSISKLKSNIVEFQVHYALNKISQFSNEFVHSVSSECIYLNTPRFLFLSPSFVRVGAGN